MSPRRALGVAGIWAVPSAARTVRSPGRCSICLNRSLWSSPNIAPINASARPVARARAPLVEDRRRHGSLGKSPSSKTEPHYYIGFMIRAFATDVLP